MVYYEVSPTVPNCPQVSEMPDETEAVAGKPRPSLLLLQVRPSLEGGEADSRVVFQLSLPGGGEDQVQRTEQVGRQAWSGQYLLSQVKLLSYRFNCFLLIVIMATLP